jgi:hypothetical protein
MFEQLLLSRLDLLIKVMVFFYFYFLLQKCEEEMESPYVAMVRVELCAGRMLRCILTNFGSEQTVELGMYPPKR